MADQEKRLALSTVLQNARENYSLMSELWEQMAREYRTKYDAFMAVGFSADQALQMICAEIGKK